MPGIRGVGEPARNIRKRGLLPESQLTCWNAAYEWECSGAGSSAAIDAGPERIAEGTAQDLAHRALRDRLD
ncbi:hypothetical protein GCM10009780_45520 [Actinomadura alba]